MKNILGLISSVLMIVCVVALIGIAGKVDTDVITVADSVPSIVIWSALMVVGFGGFKLSGIEETD